jgi:hypothetical protein
MPERKQSGGQFQGLLGRRFERPIQGGAQVVQVLLHPFQPFHLAQAGQFRLGQLGKGEKIIGVALPEGFLLAAGSQAVQGKFAQGDQHTEAIFTLAAFFLLDQAVIQQGVHCLQTARLDIANVADHIGSLQGAAAREHPQPGKQGPGTGFKQVKTPLKGLAEGLMVQLVIPHFVL